MRNVHLIDKNKPHAGHAAILDKARAPGRWVLCETRATEKTEAGIYLPESVKQGLANVVVSVGPKVADVLGFELNVGDRVVFVGGNEMALGGRRFTMVDAASINIVLDPEVAGRFFDREDAPAIVPTISGEAS